ncbi:4085_t:CDS:1, partial [Scutellospora calospora]
VGIYEKKDKIKDFNTVPDPFCLGVDLESFYKIEYLEVID